MKRIFFSFSVSADQPGRHFVRLLMARLQQIGLDPWVYESPGGQIRFAGTIRLECRKKIEEADLFMVYVTDQAVQSDFVDMEVSHALWVKGQRQAAGGDLAIVPLMATTRPVDRWAPALREAANFIGFALTGDHTASMESIVLEVCQSLATEYAPPRPATPRLPLTQRVVEEVQQYRSGSKFDMHDLARIMKWCDAAVDAHNGRDYERARKLIEGVLLSLELEYGLKKPYYPRVAYASTMMAEAHAGGCRFEDVEKKFSELIDEAGALLDANAYAGRGNARMALGRFREALDDYAAAERRLEAPDPALFYNCVRAHTMGGIPIDKHEIRRYAAILDDGLVTRQPGDISRLASVIALAHACSGEVDATVAQWRAIPDTKDVYPELVTEICHHLSQRNPGRAVTGGAALSSARSILADYIASLDAPDDAAFASLHHLAARLSYESGDLAQARFSISRLADRLPRSPVIAVDGALFAISGGDTETARRWCQRVAALADHSVCEPPIGFREFHYTQGQAYWLLGRTAEAQESFRRSGYPPDQGYAHILGQVGGLLR